MTDQLLDKWLEAQPLGEFPGGVDYISRYKTIADKLNRQVHSDVDIGALASGGEFLTDHGPEHIKAVIKRASKLIFQESSKLSAYETYILLFAIHLHDTGNIFGRDGHEKKISKVLQQLGSLAGEDQPELLMIKQIAESHGGHYNGNKDTIVNLQEKTKLLGKDIRVRLLAGILRFSDELAEDSTRASRFLMNAGELPTKSEVFHKFASCLQSVGIDKSEIELKFYIEKNDALKTFKKKDKYIYLIDEIYLRTWKTHCERAYCMRFTRPFIDIKYIRVIIEIGAQEYLGDPKVIQYVLEEKGYPEFSLNEFLKSNPDLKDGNTFKTELQNHQSRRILFKSIKDFISRLKP